MTQTIAQRLLDAADMLADPGAQPHADVTPAALQFVALELRKAATELEAQPVGDPSMPVRGYEDRACPGDFYSANAKWCQVGTTALVRLSDAQAAVSAALQARGVGGVEAGADHTDARDVPTRLSSRT